MNTEILQYQVYNIHNSLIKAFLTYKTNFMFSHWFKNWSFNQLFLDSARKFQNLPYDFRVYEGLNYVHLYHEALIK